MYQAVHCPPTRSDFDDARRRRRPGPTRSANAANGCPLGSTTSLDPILFTDHATGRTFESQLAGKAALTCYTDDDGADLDTRRTGGGINSGVDHQTIGGGPFADGVGGAASTATRTPSTTAAGHRRRVLRASAATAALTFGAGRADVQPARLRRPARPRQGRARTARPTCRTRAAAATRPWRSPTDNGADLDRPPGARPAPRATPTRRVGHRRQRHRLLRLPGRRRPRRASRSATTRARPGSTARTSAPQLGIKNIVFPAMVAGDDDRAAFAFLGTTDRRQLPGRRELPRRLAPLHRHDLRRRRRPG